MYRMVVAEDEPLLLEHAVKKIAALPLDIEIVGKAQNGEDALRLVEEKRPQILITDIRMPVMDGLELIERSLALLPELLCVIISGYDDFSYAQKAIRLNVSDYLLKPIKANQLEQVLRKLTGQIRQSQAVRQRDMILNSYIGKLQAPPSALPDASFGMCLICVGSLQTNALSIRERPTGVPSLESVLAPVLPEEDEWWLIDETCPNSKMLIYAERSRFSAASLFTPLKERLGCVTLCHTVSPIRYADIWQTGQGLRSTLRQRLVPFQSACLPLGASGATGDLSTLEQAKNAIALRFGLGQPEQTLRMIEAFLRTLCQTGLAQHVVETYLLALLDSAAEAGLELDWAALRGRALHEVATCDDAQTFVAALSALWKDVLYRSDSGSGTSADAYQAIKDYLRAHYNEDITLTSLAEQFHFSPEYVSRLFKRLDGQPPSRYLTTLRIEESKRLIRESAYLNLRMIAKLVGYPDAHYFSRIFRKVTGMTPTEYKQSALS